MNPFRWVHLRVRAILGRGALEREMKEELREHLERATARLMARGMSPADAAAAARREFGNVAMVEEDARDAWGTRLVESVLADIRFALRYFARKPLTTTTIVLVLALGIGVHITLFSVLQAYTMRAAPAVPNDDALVRIWGMQQATRGARIQQRYLAYPELEALGARTETFSDVAGWTGDDVIIVPENGGAARGIRAEYVTPNYWRTLGVAPVAGPGFAVQHPDVTDLAAVISFALAGEVFGSPPEAIGQRMLVNDIPVRVVGVAPPRFEGAIQENGRPQLWLPISARADLARTSARWLNEPRMSVFARLAPSVTSERASAIARDVSTRMLPDSAARAGVLRTAEVLSLRSPNPLAYQEEVFGYAAIGVIALLILLVACTNVSSLLVAAAVGRRHEIAVRLSLGASRARVLRQLLTESALLAVGGGTAGLLVCWWLMTLISRQENIDLEPDLLTVSFTMLFALGTGLLFGLSPALHATRAGVATALRESGTGASNRSRLQRTFVIAQIVFSQPLLVLIAILLAAIENQRVRIPDSVADRVIYARFLPLSQTGALSQRLEAVDALIPLMAAEAGVERVVPEPTAFARRDVSVASGSGELTTERAAPIRVHVEGTAPGYFGLLDIPIVLGRDVALSDTAGSEQAIVIGSELARELWGEGSPVGKTLTSTKRGSAEHDSAAMVVVGVFDSRLATTRGTGKRVYTAHGKKWRRDVLLVRTHGPARTHVPALQEMVRVSAPGLPIARMMTLTDDLREERREELQMLGATLAAGGVALLLASIGLFAVVALSVGQRRREIGIRIALGAEPLRVVRMFFRSGLHMSVLGMLIGLPISVIAVRVMISQGVIIVPQLSVTLLGLGIATIVLAVASAATWFPARKAATVDPLVALRAE